MAGGDKWMTSGGQRLKQGIQNHSFATRRRSKQRAATTRQPPSAVTAATNASHPLRRRRGDAASGTGGYSAYADPVVRRGVVVNLRSREGDAQQQQQQPHPEHPSRTRRRIRDASGRHHAIKAHYNPHYRPDGFRAQQQQQQQSQVNVRRIQQPQQYTAPQHRPPVQQYGSPLSYFAHPQFPPPAPSPSVGQSYSEQEFFDRAPPSALQHRQPSALPVAMHAASYYEPAIEDPYGNPVMQHQPQQPPRDSGIPQFQKRSAAVAPVEDPIIQSSDDMFRLPSNEENPVSLLRSPPPVANEHSSYNSRRYDDQRLLPPTHFWEEPAEHAGDFLDSLPVEAQHHDEQPGLPPFDEYFHPFRQGAQDRHQNDDQGGLNLPRRNNHLSDESPFNDKFLSSDPQHQFDPYSGVLADHCALDTARRQPLEFLGGEDQDLQQEQTYDFGPDSQSQRQPPPFASPRAACHQDQDYRPKGSKRNDAAPQRPHTAYPRLEHPDDSASTRQQALVQDRSATQQEMPPPIDYSRSRRPSGHAAGNRVDQQRHGSHVPSRANENQKRSQDQTRTQSRDKGSDSPLLQIPNRQETAAANENRASRTESSRQNPTAQRPFSNSTNAAVATATATAPPPALRENPYQRKRKHRQDNPTRSEPESQQPAAGNPSFYEELHSTKKRKDIFHTTCASPRLGFSTNIAFYNQETRVDWHNRPLPSPMVAYPAAEASNHREESRDAARRRPAQQRDDMLDDGFFDESDDDDLDLSRERSLWHKKND